MVGNSAAVQANIIVPGMAGTGTSVKIGHTTSTTRTPGVGYQAGEPYAKWGRFACDMPASFSLSRDPYVRGIVREHPSLNSPRRRPRSRGGNEADGNAGQENVDGCAGGSSAPRGVDPAGNSRDDGAAHRDDGENSAERFGGRDAARMPTTSAVRRGPAYLEVTVCIRGGHSYAVCCFLPS